MVSHYRSPSAYGRTPFKELKESQGWKRPKGKPALVMAHVCGEGDTQYLSTHLSIYNDRFIS